MDGRNRESPGDWKMKGGHIGYKAAEAINIQQVTTDVVSSLLICVEDEAIAIIHGRFKSTVCAFPGRSSHATHSTFY